MRVVLDVPDYSPDHGLRIEWDVGAEIFIHLTEQEVIIRANTAALESLAQNLLTLANPQVPTPYHVHFDEFTGLGEGSTELIIEKV